MNPKDINDKRSIKDFKAHFQDIRKVKLKKNY